MSSSIARTTGIEMTKSEFIEACNFLEEVISTDVISFEHESKKTKEVFFTCVLISHFFSDAGSLAYKEIMGWHHIPNLSYDINDYRLPISKANIQRLVALELFYTVCIDEKLYLEF